MKTKSARVDDDALLARAAESVDISAGDSCNARSTRTDAMSVHHSLAIQAAGVVLDADVVVPESAQAVVLFAHGSGSSRHSPRNRYVAGELQRAGLATVLADLLTPEEERLDARTGQLRFDIGLLATRVIALTDWVTHDHQTAGLPVGIFGASTGAAAALVAAAQRPDTVAAVVSRGGRPDLAGDYLRAVRQPTLLIVGGRDELVIELNRQAMNQLAGETRLEIVPGATHLFEEPGALEQVARLARDWFVHRLRRGPSDDER
jgi:dienelactone hydrolase